MSRLAAAALLLLASLMPTDSPDGDEARVARVNTATGVTVKDAHDAERTPRRGVPARATRAAQRLPLLEVES